MRRFDSSMDPRALSSPNIVGQTLRDILGHLYVTNLEILHWKATLTLPDEVHLKLRFRGLTDCHHLNTSLASQSPRSSSATVVHIQCSRVALHDDLQRRTAGECARKSSYTSALRAQRVFSWNFPITARGQRGWSRNGASGGEDCVTALDPLLYAVCCIG